MSDRHAERESAGAQTGSQSRAASPSAPASRTTQRPPTTIRSITSPTSFRRGEDVGRGIELPPIPPVPVTGRDAFSPSSTRIGGVSSILNPPAAEEPPPNRRRKASQLESSAGSLPSLPPIVTGSQASYEPPAFATTSQVFQSVAPGERQPRRILTPRSPSLHRATSLGQINPSAGTISAQRTPFPGSPRGRTYAIEPGTSGAPPLPTAPAGARPSYGFSAPTLPSEATRRASTGTTRARNLSSSASPSTSYSSYSQAGQTSPATQQYVPVTTHTMAPSYATGGDESFAGGSLGAGLLDTTSSERQRPTGIPISSSAGQNVYQMMTLETTSGTVQLPVDVQAASRVADEKRRRNAGASARFRQRRKEKEREASTTISKLEQQLKDLGEDADFYRRERDFLVGVVASTPGLERHLTRPTSPRHRRPSAGALPGPSGMGSAAFSSVQEQTMRSPQEERNVRRRTSTMSLPPPPPPQLPPPSPGPQQAYSQHTYATPLTPYPCYPPPPIQQPHSGPLPTGIGPPTPAQPTQVDPQQQQPSGPPQILHPMPQTGPWNPYPSERRPGPSGQSRDSR